MRIMKNNKLEELTKKIQKQVPEIMELKEGCIIDLGRDRNSTKEIGKATIFHHEDNQIWIHYHNSECTNYFNLECEQYKDIKILGRDIALEDIFFYIAKLCPASNALIHTTGAIIIDGKGSDCFWEFNKPLHEQDQNTIDYLYNLLVEE